MGDRPQKLTWRNASDICSPLLWCSFRVETFEQLPCNPLWLEIQNSYKTRACANVNSKPAKQTSWKTFGVFVFFSCSFSCKPSNLKALALTLTFLALESHSHFHAHTVTHAIRFWTHLSLSLSLSLVSLSCLCLSLHLSQFVRYILLSCSKLLLHQPDELGEQRLVLSLSANSGWSWHLPQKIVSNKFLTWLLTLKRVWIKLTRVG